MIVFCFLILFVLFVFIKFFILFVVRKYGKISYDGFDAVGFAYNSKQDIFYATQKAWQKKFGYTHLYDVEAPLLQMILDTEIVRFFYQEKHWLIVFWKGQYGMVTGAEIGVYYTEEKEIDRYTLYQAATLKDQLDMGFVLYRKGKIITSVKSRHWWLAAFKLGMFSHPKDLVMDLMITFPNQDMLEAFLTAFQKLGYSQKNYRVFNRTFYFSFRKPRTPKVWTRDFLLDGIRQFFNAQNVKLYQRLLNDMVDKNQRDDSQSEKYFNIQKRIPDFLRNSSLTKEKSENPNLIFLDSRGNYSFKEHPYE